MSNSCPCKLVKVVDITGVASFDHGLQFTSHKLFRCQHREPALTFIGQPGSFARRRRQSADTHKDVDLNLDMVPPASVIGEAEVVLKEGVVVHARLELIAETLADLPHCPFDFRPFFQHCVALDLTNVVQVDVH